MDWKMTARVAMIGMMHLIMSCDVSSSEELGVIQSESWVELGSAMGSPVVQGNTCGAANETTPTCASSSSPDHSFRWTAPTTASYTITTFGSSFDTVLQLRQFTTNHSGASLGCNDDSGGTLQSSVTANLSAGQVIEITIDGYGSGKCGSYKLNITSSGSCPGGCNSPPGPCYNSTGTCSNGTCVYSYKPAGSSCTDGLSCTSGDQCNGSGSCSGSSTCGEGYNCTSQGCTKNYSCYGYLDCGPWNCCVQGTCDNCQIWL